MPGAWLNASRSQRSAQRRHQSNKDWYAQTQSDSDRNHHDYASSNDSYSNGYDLYDYADPRERKRSSTNIFSWMNKKLLIVSIGILIITSLMVIIFKFWKRKPTIKSVREAWATRAPSEMMQDPDDLDMVEFPSVPSDVYKDHIRSLLRQSSQLLDKANQDKNPVYKVMHTSQAIAYANALQKIANPETIQHVGNANLNEFVQVLEDAQTRAVQDLFMEAPDLQSNIPYSMTTAWSAR